MLRIYSSIAHTMLRHKIKIGLFFVIVSIIISFIFFTSIYINIFQSTFQKNIASKLDVNKVKYNYVEGSLIEGFFINELKIYSKDFLLSSDKVELSINLVDIFNGFSDVEFIKFENVDLFLKDSDKKSSAGQFVKTDFLAELISFTGLPIRSVGFINFNISDNQDTLLFNELSIKSDFEKKTCKIEGDALGSAFNYNFSFNKFVAELSLFNKKFHIDNLRIDNGYNALNLEELDVLFQFEALKEINTEIKAKGDASLFGYNFIINSFQLADNNEYKLNIGPFDKEDISFDRILLSGPLDFSGDFSVQGFRLLNQDFYTINGNIQYLNDSFYLKIPYIEREKKDKSILAGELHFYDTFVDIKELKLKIDESNPLVLAKSSTCSILDGELVGDKLEINYKDGKIFIDDFKFKNSEHYDFELRLVDLDLDLFRGLKTKGKLTAEYLKISDKDSDERPFSAEFYDAKIRNLSNKDVDNIDELSIKGSFSDYELNITSMNVTKKIAFFSVSAGFSSLDDFYAKTIDNLKVKIK